MSSSNSTTPSEYTSLAVVSGVPRILLGARVRRGEGAPAGAGERRGPRRPAGIEQGGHPEVEQPDLPFVGDQDVGRLEVAVEDEVRVRELHRRQYLKKQPEAGLDVELARVAEGGDVTPVHALHRQVRLPLGHAGVVEPGDVRVLEAGEDVALAGEAHRHVPAGRVQQRQLERHVAPERPVVPPREPHLAHPAAAEQLHEQVGPDALPGAVGTSAVRRRRGGEGIGLGCPRLDEPPDSGRQRGLAPARAPPARRRGRQAAAARPSSTSSAMRLQSREVDDTMLTPWGTPRLPPIAVWHSSAGERPAGPPPRGGRSTTRGPRWPRATRRTRCSACSSPAPAR